MKKTILVIGLMCALYFCFSMAVGLKSAAIRANQRACFENINNLEGLSELSEIDLATGTAEIKQLHFGSLVQDGYLEEFPKCPFDGNYLLNGSSVPQLIYCSFHGDPMGSISGKLDPGYSIFYWFGKWIEGVLK